MDESKTVTRRTIFKMTLMLVRKPIVAAELPSSSRVLGNAYLPSQAASATSARHSASIF